MTLHMEKLLRWEDAVDSLKLQVGPDTAAKPNANGDRNPNPKH